jgi:hypothetical protein
LNGRDRREGSWPAPVRAPLISHFFIAEKSIDVLGEWQKPS